MQPCIHDRNWKGDGILLYVRENIPVKLLNSLVRTNESSKNYDNVILLVDFNTCINDNAMASQTAWYKNPDKST